MSIEITDERMNREIEDFFWYLTPFGSSDIKNAIRDAIAGGHDGRWLAEEIADYMENTDLKLNDIDPNYVCYDSLLQEARSDIDQLTNIDILNDTMQQIEVCGNFMCTSLDYTEDAKDELLKILADIPDEDYTDAMTWLKGELN